MKSFILVASIPDSCNCFPELQLSIDVVLHRFLDYGFDAAPFRFHVIEGESSRCCFGLAAFGHGGGAHPVTVPVIFGNIPMNSAL
jgi:hypothetical protein